MKVISQQVEVFKQTVASSAGTDANYVQTIVTPALMPVNGALETIRIDNIECIIAIEVAINSGVTAGAYGTIEYMVGDNELLVTNDFTSPHSMYYRNNVLANVNTNTAASIVFYDSGELQKANALIIKPQVNVMPTFRTQVKRNASIAVSVIIQVTYSKIKITSDEFIALFAA
jgi:cellobiose-specific phosphotransferase system component IIB